MQKFAFALTLLSAAALGGCDAGIAGSSESASPSAAAHAQGSGGPACDSCPMSADKGTIGKTGSCDMSAKTDCAKSACDKVEECPNAAQCDETGQCKDGPCDAPAEKKTEN